MRFLLSFSLIFDAKLLQKDIKIKILQTKYLYKLKFGFNLTLKCILFMSG